MCDTKCVTCKLQKFCVTKTPVQMKGQHSMLINKLQASHRPHYSKNG